MHLTSRDPEFVIRALLHQPERERRMSNRMWWGYQTEIERQSRMDDAIRFELHPAWQFVLLGINTWVIVGLIGFLIGAGFWNAVAWGVLAALAFAYMWLGIALYLSMLASFSRDR